MSTPKGTGYVQLAAPGSPTGTTAVNAAPKFSRAGLVLTAVRDGQVTIAVYGTDTQLVVDLLGYQTVPAGPPPSASPTPTPVTPTQATPTAAARRP